MDLAAVLHETLALQKVWTSSNSEPMQRRGHLIRDFGPSALEEERKEFAHAFRVGADGVVIEGRDGTGPKSEIPWFRYGSLAMSPRATDGWYCVYLFCADGSAVYLSLTCGSTNWNGSSFIPRNSDELLTLASWGKSVAAKELPELEVAARTSSQPMDLRATRSPLGPAYEHSSALSVKYDAENIPEASVLLSDARDFARLLGNIYLQVKRGEEPGSLSPEVWNATIGASEAAGKSLRSGQGFRVGSAERRAVEAAAMDVARSWLESRGWSVIDRSASAPFDFECTREEERLYVEVKGTTSRGEQIVLTRNEVEHHQQNFPNNALIVVSEILLNAKGRAVTDHSNVRVVSPWRIDEDKLQVISFTYRL